MHRCNVCKREFTRGDNLKRHILTSHSCNEKVYEYESNNGGGGGGLFQFYHPFTMTVSGPTSCGKTFLVKKVLQENSWRITPIAQRIVWLYKRWQPLYNVIRATVSPPVEFIQGIPIDLDKDTFLNPNMNNLIILDDLMSTASKDPRINELFTEGSHHRNLSVIAINQNLYYSKDPTQRRNCHYLALFNSPIDKQQVMTLARQMYPDNFHYFMRHFSEATSKPYGYLLVDLKPTTPEYLRMRINALDEKTDGLPIKGQNLSIISHFTKELQDLGDQSRPSKCQYSENEVGTKTITDGIETPAKKRRGNIFNDSSIFDSEVEDEEEDSQEDSKEDETFRKFSKRAIANNREELIEKVEKYKGNGLSKKEAQEKAFKKMKDVYLMDCLERYGQTLINIIQLKGGKMHTKVMKSVGKYIENGYETLSAVRISLLKYKHQLQEHMFEDDDDESETDEESDVEVTEEIKDEEK